MNMQLAVIGAGPAGMAAAIEAKKNGIKEIVILEREAQAGGILQQCIHTGFGLQIFKEELTGPEYAHRFIEECRDLNISVLTGTTVLSISKNKTVTAVNPFQGVFEIHAQSVILATGCRERPRGALRIPGSRPAGIFTAGNAQKFVNIDGMLPGREVVILGSGDIGLIMARRLTLEGAHVIGVLELKEYSSGLQRNIVQCLEDFDIPLLLSHTVVEIHGKKRLNGLTVAKVDAQYRPLSGTKYFIPCDTLLLSVGLIPENELAKDHIVFNLYSNAPLVDERLECSIPGIFSCGNALHVHDVVDEVTFESRLAGRNAAKYIFGYRGEQNVNIQIQAASGLAYILPHIVRSKTEDVTFSFRSDNIYKNTKLRIECGGHTVFDRKTDTVTPGRMEHVTLTKELLSKVSGNLTFSLGGTHA